LHLPAEPDLTVETICRAYDQRWPIEDAYNIVKRLLGLAFFWCGAQNAFEMQVWLTWRLYIVLIDLTDAVAETLNKPFMAISIEMVYRSLYFLRTPDKVAKPMTWLIIWLPKQNSSAY
jgi:hypothetical protein